MRTVLAGLLVAVGSASALAQPVYNFEMRLISDGVPGAPTPGAFPNNFIPYNLGNFHEVTRIGFWLQARVGVTGDAQNWGIVRATSPADGVSSITVSSIGNVSLSRGHVGYTGSAPGTAAFGRGLGYRNGGTATGSTGNTGDSQPFPGTGGNENGGLDNGGSGDVMRRIYGFDSWVGSTRPGNGEEADNPWGINGGGASGPMPSDGTMSPWANLYHVWVDISSFPPPVPGEMPGSGLFLSASVYLTGSTAASPTDDSFSSWEMQEGPGRLMTATWGIPTPSAASVLVLGALVAARRRR